MNQCNHPIMQCGCVASATDGEGKPVCPVHFGLHPAATLPMDPQPVIASGRVAKCALCGKDQPSGVMLAFFEYRPDQPNDIYYCGCRGWD